jgi:hypothetical protein
LARQRALEALQFHIVGMVEVAAAIPAPTSLASIMGDPANRNAIAITVTPSLAVSGVAQPDSDETN